MTETTKHKSKSALIAAICLGISILGDVIIQLMWANRYEWYSVPHWTIIGWFISVSVCCALSLRKRWFFLATVSISTICGVYTRVKDLVWFYDIFEPDEYKRIVFVYLAYILAWLVMLILTILSIRRARIHTIACLIPSLLIIVERCNSYWRNYETFDYYDYTDVVLDCFYILALFFACIWLRSYRDNSVKGYSSEENTIDVSVMSEKNENYSEPEADSPVKSSSSSEKQRGDLGNELLFINKDSFLYWISDSTNVNKKGSFTTIDEPSFERKLESDTNESIVSNEETEFDGLGTLRFILGLLFVILIIAAIMSSIY